jgi:hypothetical protein
MSPGLQTVAAVALAGTLMSGAAGLQTLREARYPVPEEVQETLYITSGNAVLHLTKGYHALAADLYWIRAIQYYGGTKLEAATSDTAAEHADYGLLYPLLDLTTTLDPRFNIAYRFGAIYLAEAQPGGAGRPDLAIALLEKGLKERPDKWEYMQDIGFVNYWWRHDYHAASDWFLRASQVPGAPWWLRSLAATTLAEGGDRRSSRQMWESIRESAEIDWLRHDAERRLLQLRALDEIDALQAAVDRFRKSNGRSLDSWQPLVQAGILRGVPLDPQQAPYQIDTPGRVSLSAKSPLFPLPDEPQHMVAPPS